MAFAVIHQIVEKEFGGLFHDGIAPVRQELAVAAEGIVLPQMQAQPGCAHRPHARTDAIHRRGVSPGVGVVMGHEAVRAVHFFGGFPPHGLHVFDQLEQRLVHLCKIADL